MNPDQTPTDPYAAPLAPVEVPSLAPSHETVLAGRGTRLGANLLDSLVLLLIAIPFIIGMVMKGESQTMSPLVIALFGASAIGFLALLVVQLRMLAKQGQTLGKKWMSIRIVRRDGSKASFGRIFGLRIIVNGLPGAIPIVGPLYSILDILFIFTKSRQCLHDQIADTKVIQA